MIYRILTISLFSLISLPVEASFVELCQFKAELVERAGAIRKNSNAGKDASKGYLAAFKVHIIDASAFSGSHTDCRSWIGRTVEAEIHAPEGEALRRYAPGDRLTLQYETYNFDASKTETEWWIQPPGILPFLR